MGHVCSEKRQLGANWWVGQFGFAMAFFLEYTRHGVKAGSSIRQSSGLQIRRLQVRFLPRLPTTTWSVSKPATCVHHGWRDGGVVDRARLENERTNVPRVRIPLSPPFHHSTHGEVA